EVRDGDITFGAVGAPGVDTHRLVGDVVVAHHQDVRQLLHLGPADPPAEGLLGRVGVGAEPGGGELRHQGVGEGRVVVAYGQDPRLNRSEPGREGAAVVLDQ